MQTGDINRLGRRLCKEPPDPKDLERLGQLQDEHLGALELADARLKEMGLVSGARFQNVPLTVTNRLKRDRRIIEKLARPNPGIGPTRLSTMQDIVGFRLVGQMTLRQQDRLSEALRDAFEGHVRDRRAEPSHGYRAMHVVAKVDGFSIEIQVRTTLQDYWAQRMEALSRRWGREIQYGEPVEGTALATITARTEALDKFLEVAGAIAKYEETLDIVLADFEDVGGRLHLRQGSRGFSDADWQRRSSELAAHSKELVDMARHAEELIAAADEIGD